MAEAAMSADEKTHRDLLVRRVPMTLHRALRIRAAINGRTVEQEHLAILAEKLTAEEARRLLDGALP